MKRAIIIGASSGIGRELAVILAQTGFSVGLAGRRLHLLDKLKNSLPGRVCVKQMDVANHAAAIVNVAYRHFVKAGEGHLVDISSIAAIRGSREAPAYNASKAFMSNYLEGLRNRAIKAGLPIAVTDIQPGFVDTDMAKGEGLFWVAPPQKAARQIYKAIQRKARRAYVTKRWGLIAWLLKVLPDALHARL